jgi:hypothetical protein
MGDRGIGTRHEKAKEVRQNDKGKIMQTQTMLFLSVTVHLRHGSGSEPRRGGME